jgi:hypothetical protein
VEKAPPELEDLLKTKQLLPAELYKCPIDDKLTAVSAVEVEAMSCPEHAVPLVHVKHVYILCDEAYQAWNVWMEEYTREIAQRLPCKYVEAGLTLKPIDVPGVCSPEEVDLVAVYDGQSIAVECVEYVSTNQEKDDVSSILQKLESLGLFNSVILVYKHVDNTQRFNSLVRRHQKILFPVLIENPKDFAVKLSQTLRSIKQAQQCS